MIVAITGVLSVNAQTPKYGTTYNSSEYSYYNAQAQMPDVQMQSTSSAIMRTGSTLPSAATEGVTTTYDRHNVSGPRRALDDGDEDKPKPGQPFPIGDTFWPLALLACAYLIVRAARRRVRKERQIN